MTTRHVSDVASCVNLSVRVCSSACDCITSGEGIMIIDGVEIELYPGDTVDVPQGAEYIDAGNFTAVAMSIPPFDESKLTVIE